MMTTTLEGRRGMGAGPLSERFDKALLFASHHDRQQMRMGSQVPYLSHLVSVGALVLEHGGNEDQAIAALLPDAVEDTRRARPRRAERNSVPLRRSRGSVRGGPFRRSGRRW